MSKAFYYDKAPKKEMLKVKMTEGTRAIIQQLFQEYNLESASDIQDAPKDLL